MGKYVVLAVLAVALGTTLLARQGMLTDLDTSASQAHRQKQVLAREIARSAFEMGVSELRRDFENWRVDRTQVEHEGGYFDLEASGPSGGPVSLTAVGYHGDTAYEITGEAVKDTSVTAMANGITARIPITFDVSGGGCGGEHCVSGIDAGGREDRHGITLPPDTDPTPSDVCKEFNDKVEGKEEGCDVKARSSGEDDWVESQMTKLDAEIQKAIDEGSGDVTVCDTECSLKDLSSDSGILYVTGKLEVNGSRKWNGLVFVTGGGSVRINGGGSETNINGGLMMSDSTDYQDNEDVDLNGGNVIQYNSDEIRKYMDTFPTLRRTTVQVTGRSERVRRPSDE